MALQTYPSLVLVVFACFVCYSYAYQFNVGGRDGWVTNPSENFNHWAERLRFQVNDTLRFKYNKGSDSVLVVNNDDYEKCQTDKPILKLDDGNSIFKFDRSGPFYFISGNKQHCEKGQKLIIIVLAVRNNRNPPSVPKPPKAPAPAGKAPVASPPKGSTPHSSPPAVTPGSPAPAAKSPTPSPVPAVSPAPVASHKAPSPSPSSPAPSPHHSSAVSAFTPTVMLVSTFSFVINVALGGFIISF